MPSKRETVLNALLALLSGIAGPEVERNMPEGREVPAAGRIDIRDGKLDEPEAYLSPPTYGHTLNAEVVAMARAVESADRDAAVDALLLAAEAKLAADPTLGGLVESATLGNPEFLTEAVENGVTIKAALAVVALEYTSDSPLG